MTAKQPAIAVVGLDDVKQVLGQIAPKHAKNLNRVLVHALAGELAKVIKSRAPTGSTGNLKKSIKTRRRRSTPDSPISEVYFASGKDKKNDGFYWRFVEHGTQASQEKGSSSQPARPFVEPAKTEFMQTLPTQVQDQFVKKFAKLVEREQKKVAKAAAKAMKK